MSSILPAVPVQAGSPASYKKKKIPKALREALWVQYCGKSFEVKCRTTWCQNQITAYDFHAGHNIPESRGGPTTLENLVPICSRCNLSMGNQYTFTEWCNLRGSVPQLAAVPAKAKSSFWCCSGAAAATQVAEPGPSPAPLLEPQRRSPRRSPPAKIIPG